MHREFNSPVEILRRLAYVVYVLVFLAYLISCVVALARPGKAEIIVACCAFCALAAVRWIGHRWLDFGRMTESFPCGCPLDRVPEAVRDEVETLVEEFSADNTEWTRRVEIRHRLIELEEQVPEIIHAYESDLKRVLAA